VLGKWYEKFGWEVRVLDREGQSYLRAGVRL
jgi:hypothetical protein